MNVSDRADGTDELDRADAEHPRRRVLLGAGAALSTLLAGCSVPGGGGEEGEGGENGGGGGGENEGGEGGGGENEGGEGGGGGENDD